MFNSRYAAGFQTAMVLSCRGNGQGEFLSAVKALYLTFYRGKFGFRRREAPFFTDEQLDRNWRIL
jgi:hypothetical protein